MTKAGAVVFIVLIQVATTMPSIMAWTPPPPPTYPPPPPPTSVTKCPPPPPTSAAKCPLDALKLGACVDLLGGLVHIGIGDPVENQCCPVIEGVLGLEAALCLCTTIRAKLLDLNILLPLALELIVSCGKTVPPGFQCPAL
ncbi:36.4 kDa proline-rich protein-like [Cryptomeria japonica]|uniref:36.4 kDa proline-rich protein-like n=1 Tax=Cryptomeria japonica TaxID=3369 RepID=UPI0027DA353C|nr:36.4 kDa proline-rich protein-like [Cryptomeria japonica]